MASHSLSGFRNVALPVYSVFSLQSPPYSISCCYYCFSIPLHVFQTGPPLSCLGEQEFLPSSGGSCGDGAVCMVFFIGLVFKKLLFRAAIMCNED